jgi:N-acetylglucosamine-6-phosphate deacetylase
MQQAYSASQVFTGYKWLENQIIITDQSRIQSILPRQSFQQKIPLTELEDAILVPGFVDIQVYGAGGKLLSAFPESETLQLMYDEFLRTGTVLFQPTIATNSIDVFKKSIDSVRSYMEKGGNGVAGIHLEGPWINEIKRGAHKTEWIHTPTINEVREILEYGKGVIRTITLAPEKVSKEVIQLIRSYNIIISAGHSNATYQEAIGGFDNGIGMVTHLYNAMSPLQHREPGLVGATMNTDGIVAAIIPDGYHVDFVAIQIAKKLMKERLFAITDAVTETTIGPYQHYRNGDKYESNGILSGSAISMYQAFRNLINKAGIQIEEAQRMCSLYPAKAIGMGTTYGQIAEGFSTPIIVLEKNLEFRKLIN